MSTEPTPARFESVRADTRPLREQIANLRQLAEAATPGPWTTDEPRPRYITAPSVEHIKIDEADWGEDVRNMFMVRTVWDPAAWSYADTRYIAAVSPDVVVALLDEIERLSGPGVAAALRTQERLEAGELRETSALDRLYDRNYEIIKRMSKPTVDDVVKAASASLRGDGS